MISYEVKTDPAQVAEAIDLFRFIGGNADDALRIAINKTAPKIKTRASSAIRSQVRLTASYVGSRLTVTKATRKSLTGAIKTPSRGLLLSRFSTDPLIAGDKVGWIRPPATPAQGIKIKIKPDGSPVRAPGLASKPFYVRLNGGQNIGIASRIGAGRQFKVFAGPSLSQVFNTVRGDVLPAAGQELTDKLIDAIRDLLVKMHPPEPAE